MHSGETIEFDEALEKAKIASEMIPKATILLSPEDGVPDRNIENLAAAIDNIYDCSWKKCQIGGVKADPSN